jgi:hypothetical protein
MISYSPVCAFLAIAMGATVYAIGTTWLISNLAIAMGAMVYAIGRTWLTSKPRKSGQKKSPGDIDASHIDLEKM